VEEETTGSRACVDGVGQTFELDALLLKLPDEVDQMFDAATEPVQFSDHKGVSSTESVTSLGETGALGSAPAHPVFEDLLTAGSLKSLSL
jgi:hypothetical protein